MSTKIDWADEVINPLGWGCYGPTGTKENPRPCSYCYAKEFAARHLRDCPDCNDFIPHWHPEQLDKLYHWKKSRTIFVQSMGDLFHAETPKKHIEATLEACRANPQHTYMFLTKNPGRYSEFAFSSWDWLGTTIESNNDYPRVNALKDVATLYPVVRPKLFVSIEPILGNVDWPNFYDIDLLIVGAMTGPNAIKPKKEWIESVLNTRHPNILWKENIKSYLDEYGLVV